LINTKKEYYILDINLLDGKEEIEFNTDENRNENKIYYLTKDFKENFNLFSSPNKNYTINLTLLEKDSIIYYRRIKSQNSDNIKEIYFGKSNYLTHEKEKDKISYQSFFINLNDTIINEDIHLNYKFLEIFEQNYQDNINLDILLVDEEYILNKKGVLNNNNLNFPTLGDIIYYKKDMGAGYALINKSFISENKEKNNYIYIKLEKPINQKFDFVITLTDFSEYYDMPVNIYLFMFIKNEFKLEIKKEYEESPYKPFVEISHDSNLIVEFNQGNITRKNIHGKTLFGLQNGTFIFTFNNNESEVVKAPNLLIKYGLSDKENYSHFRLIDSNINYTDSDKNINFNPIENISEFSDFSVIYNILIYDEKNSYDKIFEKKKTIGSKIYKGKMPSNRVIQNSIFDILEGKFGTFYINILAEAKLKNVNTDNYEYILYQCSDIQVKVDINIEEKEKSFNFSHEEDIIINANISYIGNQMIQYKFIKLVLIENGYYPKRLEIYASTKESLLNDQNQEEKSLYERSEYKSVDSYNKTVLAIPLNNGDNSPLDKLYIRIPCKEKQEFQLIYRIEDGRKMEGISINENACFDILLENIPDDGKNLNYRFVYTTNKINYPLITFTTYEINNDYKIITTGMENEYLKKSFYNGYSFLFQYSNDYYEYHTFIIIPRITTIFKICHRRIEKEEIKNEETKEKEAYIFKPISIGENIYSFLRNKKGILKDCFEIENRENVNYTQYMFNYISKTKNIRLLINDKENEDNNILYLFNESGSIFLNSSKVSNFCIGLREEANSILAKEYHGSINFQIVGINITQNENIPLISLINGYSVKHTLHPGQKLYYRLNKYIIYSEYLELYFQDLQGDISIKQSHCSNYPNYSCKDGFDEVLDINQCIYKNNFYHYIRIDDNDDNDIYNKADFPVYLVYCKDTSNKNCVYYIGMNNENSALALNEKRKIYFRPKENKIINFATDFYGEEFVPHNEDEEYHEHSRKYYLEIHLLEGGLNASNIFINGSNNLHNFDKKTYYYSPLPSKLFGVGFYSFPCSLTLIKESLVYITYHILLNKTYEGTKVDDIYNMYEDEMHYNLLTPDLETFSYYYPKIHFENNTPNETYFVSISGINSFISYDNSEKYKKYHQFILSKNVTQIKCHLEDSERNPERQCEFIFSFAKLNNNSKSICKKVEFDGFYQYYEINDTINEIFLYYDLTKEKLIELSKNYILVTINKDNLEKLTINYGFRADFTEEDFKNLPKSQSKNTSKRIEIFKINLNTLEDESNIQLGNNAKMNTQKYLLFRLTSKSNTNFKIKINIKNNPTHLFLDEIEFGYLEPNESLYYYFDYMSPNDKDTPKDLEEIYLYNKGNAKMKVAILKNSKDYPYNPYDMYSINYDDSSIEYNDTISENNHFKITNIYGKDYKLGFRVYIKVYLDYISNINYNLFSIYRNTQKERGRLIKLNTNNFGNIYFNNSENYKFYINNLTKIKDNLIINLDCNNCSLKLYDHNQNYFQINSSYILNRKKHEKIFKDDQLLFNISGEKGNYLFSFSDPNLPKYIEESEPELCLNSCKFVFPLHNYYHYITVDNDIAKIIFFSPDIEKIKIYVKIADESEIGNDPLSNFDLTANSTQKFNNKKFYNLNISEIEQNSYLRIQVTSDDKNRTFHFIMNKFIKSNNTEIKHTNQIIYLKKNDNNDNKIYSIDEEDRNYFHKFSLELISGQGIISLAKDNEYKLDYEYHPSISLILKLDDYSILARNIDTGKDFTFFISVTKLEKNYTDIATQIDEEKTYRIKYNISESEFDIFPLNLKVRCKQGSTTFVSYRFIKKKHSNKNTDSTLYNSTDLDFYADSKNNIDNNTLYFESIYYPDFQRGIIIIKPNDNYNESYIDLILNKSENNNVTYKNIYLEVALVYLNNKNNENIYIPKDAYVQFDLNDTNKNYTLEFFELEPESKHFQIEIANTNFVNIINNIDNCKLEKNYGKYTCQYSTDTNKNTIIINSNSSVTVLVKYTTRIKENEFPYFTITDINIKNEVNSDKENKENKNDNETTVKLIQNNITTNYSYNDTFLTYFVRLYDYLRFYEEEMYSILVRSNGNMSFRMDWGKTPYNDKSNDTFNYTVNFGHIKKGTYFINVIGEVTFEDSVEYLSYNYTKFRLNTTVETKFEQNWIIPLVLVLLMFCVIVAYIIYYNVKKCKQKKTQKREGVAYIIINEEKGMEDITEKDKEDNDEEDNNEENNDEENNDEEKNDGKKNDESLIKI